MKALKKKIEKELNDIDDLCQNSLMSNYLLEYYTGMKDALSHVMVWMDSKEPAPEQKHNSPKLTPYQACPKCKGEKRVLTDAIFKGWSVKEYTTCDVCDGKGIIPMHREK